MCMRYSVNSLYTSDADQLNMAASATVGSYVAVVALGLHLHAALPHVISSALLRRAVSPSYHQALLVLPFQILGESRAPLAL